MKKFGVLGILVIFLGVLIGCTEKSDQNQGASNTSSVEQPSSNNQEKPVKGETVVVYGPESMTWLEEVIGADFYEKTGNTLEYHGISGVVGRIKLEKVAPKADVVLGLTPISMAQAKSENLLAPYKPNNANLIANPEYIMDKDWYATPFDYGALAINYHMGTLPNPPATFEEIATLSKQLIVEDPRSFTGQEFMLWTIALYGEDGWLDFWRALKPAILTVTPSWDEAFAKFTAGEAPMMVGFSTSDLYFVQEEGNQLDSFIPTNGGYVYQEGAALVAKKEIKEGAKAFIEYLLEPTFQSVVFDNNYMLPITGVPVPGIEEVPQADSIVSFDAAAAAVNLERWTEELLNLLQE